MWHILRILETADGHSGYDFSWSPYRLIPMSAGARYHNYHQFIYFNLSTHNSGNFASFFTFWDTLFKTNVSYYKHLNSK